MAAPHVLILNSGGLRSLVATALAVHDEPQPRATLLHVSDGGANRAPRRDHCRRQADAFEIKRVIELDLSHLHRPEDTAGPARKTDTPPLLAVQLLVAALAQARLVGAARVIWPAAVNGEFHAIARATEQVLLLDQLAEIESPGRTSQVDAPLLDYTDRQVLELGAQLGVSWGLAWSCRKPADRPCGECAPCRRRGAAFDAAGLLDARSG